MMTAPFGNNLSHVKTTLIVLALLTLLLPASAQTQNSRRPVLARLSVSVNGPGQILLHHDGEMLDVSRRYVMVAVPDRGHTFLGWTPANVFTFVNYTIDESGGLTATTNIVVSPVPPVRPNRVPVLNFGLEPENTIFFEPGETIITRSTGWIANFSTASHLF